MKHNNIYEEIAERMKALANPCYINIFAGDDQKKDKRIYSEFYDVHKVDLKEIKSQISIKNTSSLGVFMNFNLLTAPKRINDNIEKILYIFIDLDDANEEHNDLIKTNLKAKNINYCYNAKSGNGYHFLIPVSLDNKDKPLVKGFLEYLRNNVCDKVDVATHTNERLLRCPESIHNKNEKNPIELKTLDYKTLSDSILDLNTSEIQKYQASNKKGVKSDEYIKCIKKDDIFFSSILNAQDKWKTYIDYLKNSKDRNNIFIKNLGIFLHHYPSKSGFAKHFIERFEPARIPALEGWIKKAKDSQMNVNYYELLRWSKENKLELFEQILKESQLKNTFLDDYEIYYLEDEKSDNNNLLYYPEKNYYVQKSSTEILKNIYYDCKEKGLNLEEELNMEDLYENWKTLPFKKKYMYIQDQLLRIIDKENRIRLVYNLNYEPTDDKFVYLGNKKFFNIYAKTELWDYYKKQDKYNFPFIKELIMNLCGDCEKNYKWFINWIAHQIQKPTEKIPTAVILQGKQGSGKGTLKNLVFDNIFGDNCKEINQTHLESSFNDYLLGSQIIFANEVMHNENRQTLPNVLKNLVTDPQITINIKFKKSITSNNYTHWIFCTNSDNPIKIDEDDRRYSVFYSKAMRKGLATDIRKNLDYELKEFISYLKELNPSFEEVSTPIMTDAKREIIDLNKDSFSRFKEFCEEFKTLDECWKKLFGELKNNLLIAKAEAVFIRTDDLYLLYEKYCDVFKERGRFAKQNFSKKMSNNEVYSKPKRIDETTMRVYDLNEVCNILFPNKIQI